MPFISYGGSSMISLAYAMGMLLALTREQPRAAMLTPAPESGKSFLYLPLKGGGRPPNAVKAGGWGSVT